MTALPLRDFTDAERAKLEAIEASPAEPESVRERVARAIAEVTFHWDFLGESAREWQRKKADAALAVLSGPRSDAERAVERVLALADRADRSRGFSGMASTVEIRAAVAGD